MHSFHASAGRIAITAMLMLWSRRSDDAIGRLEALHQAQLWMLENYRPTADELKRGPVQGTGKPIDTAQAKSFEANDPLPPFFWSGFALSGDWR